MINEIIKRDGTVVPFEEEKITKAIEKAMNATAFSSKNKRDEAKKLADEVLAEIERQGKLPPHIEQVQDIVENILIKHNYPDLAKAYIIYRRQHQELRETISLSEQLELIDSYIYETDWMVNENANMGYSLQGLNTFITSKITSTYWLNKVYPIAARTAHKNGDIHIHQLNALGPYCVGWDLKDLLMKGFRGAAGKIESNPPKHLRTALMQIVNFFYTLQGECVGAQALSNFDTFLAPFVRFDGLSYLEVKQAMQEFIFNMNVPTRVGFQTPFTNLTMDLLIPDHIKNEAVIIGGKLTSNTYSEFQEEANMINRAFAEVMSAGDASGRVFTFPIPTYNITKGFDWDNPNYNSIWEMTGKYGIPYFSNFINSDMKPEDARSMCCRLRLDTRELRKRGGGLFGANPLTGSIGVFTINLPRIGFLAKSEGEFMERLGKMMDVCRDALEVKRITLEKLTDRGLYPYSKYYLKDIKAAYGQYWKNHFSTIGIIGMNEACTNLLGKDISDKDSREFAIRVLDFIRARLEEYQLSTNNIYNLEATPAESTSYALASKDKERYSKIIVANEEAYRKSKAAPYYTNSSNLPVGYTDDVFEALVHQDELQIRYTGGTVIHVFLGETMPSIESTKKFVRKIAENFRLPYYTLTPTFSICPKHGYMSGSHEYCPKCDEAILNKMLNKVVV
jgi:ribonucleoside-triphosphate reductase